VARVFVLLLNPKQTNNRASVIVIDVDKIFLLVYLPILEIT